MQVKYENRKRGKEEGRREEGKRERGDGRREKNVKARCLVVYHKKRSVTLSLSAGGI
jgi:hypothetical protein